MDWWWLICLIIQYLSRDGKLHFVFHIHSIFQEIHIFLGIFQFLFVWISYKIYHINNMEIKATWKKAGMGIAALWGCAPRTNSHITGGYTACTTTRAATQCYIRIYTKAPVHHHLVYHHQTQCYTMLHKDMYGMYHHHEAPVYHQLVYHHQSCTFLFNHFLRIAAQSNALW